jgi:hypothetical protein
MIVLECTSMARHAVPSALHAVPSSAARQRKNGRHTQTAANSEKKMQDRRGACTYLAALSQRQNLSLRVYVTCCHGVTCLCARCCSVATLSQRRSPALACEVNPDVTLVTSSNKHRSPAKIAVCETNFQGESSAT